MPKIIIEPAIFGRRWPMELHVEKGEGGEVIFHGKVDAGLSKVPAGYCMPRSVALDLYEALGDVLMDRR